MPTRAVVLLSGGLDSILAVRILQEQGIEVEALNFRTMFACCQETAAQAAQRLGIKISVIGSDDDYLDLVRKPKYGYGRGANPCIDCRIYMFERARQHMDDTGASMVVSGEVLGQRPKSQKKRDLLIIEAQSGLEGRLLRPLSAKLLPPTIPEQTGEVDRERLYDFTGRSRKGLIALAEKFGFQRDEIPSPSTGCTLTEQTFAPRVFDLLKQDVTNTPWDFELLKIGRHVRLNSATKAIIGRRADENEMLKYLAVRADNRTAATLQPDNFAGPVILLVGDVDEPTLDTAGGLAIRFSNKYGERPVVLVEHNGQSHLRAVTESETAASASIL